MINPGSCFRQLAAITLLAMILVIPSGGGASAKEVSLSQNGIKLNAELVMADDKKMSDGVVLILHGTLAHNRMEIIKTMQSLLAERGRNSLAINLGLGLNDRAGMYDCKVPITGLNTDALDEIGLWLNWLKSQGAKDITLMGHSRGGNQVAWFAAERPDRAVTKLVLLAPATWNKEAAKKTYNRRFGFDADVVLAKAEKLVADGKGNQMLEKTGVVYCRDVQSTAAAFVSYHKPDQRLDTPSLLPKISVPILVIAGEKDDVVEGLIEAVKPMVDGDKVSLTVVDGADHYFLDFAAEDAADAVDEFLGN
ncbi:hypothetical protein MNBD_ALPHA08-924 [hydrothermal vent metagenome]|uniref:AB hydrolase-1 domain-containing protein n=1 Tax=hydrothermal vent metagenome TaxID=652676 RepID=A0A3B0RF15_9ZZZZ